MPLPSNIDVLDDSGAFTPELVYKPNPTFPIREDKKRGILFSNFFLCTGRNKIEKVRNQ